MRDLSFYLDRIRAFPGRPILVWAYQEGDQWFWWEVYVMFAANEGAEPWSGPWFDYVDPVIGRLSVSTDEVAGQRFAKLIIADPPGDVFVDGHSFRVEYPEGYERDLDGKDQEVTKDFGARLAAALGVPFAFEDPFAPSRRWWELPEGQLALDQYLQSVG